MNEKALSLIDWMKLAEVRATLKAQGFAEFTILEISGVAESELDSAQGRLKDLGFVPQAQGKLLSQSRSVEPIFIEILDSFVALRGDEAEMVYVRSASAQ